MATKSDFPEWITLALAELTQPQLAARPPQGLSEEAEKLVAAAAARFQALLRPEAQTLPAGLNASAERAVRAARARYHEATVPPLREPGCCQPVRIAATAPTVTPRVPAR